MYRKTIVNRMKAVEEEFRAAALAASDLMRRSADDPTILHSTRVSPAALRACRDHLEDTYLVRLFAVFEEALREVRRVLYRRNGPIKTYDLLRQCTSRQHIPDKYLENADKVREYRGLQILS